MPATSRRPRTTDPASRSLVPSTGVEPTDGYSVGTPIDLTLRDPAHPADETSRYLFHLTQLGLRDVVVQRSPRLRRRIRVLGGPEHARQRPSGSPARRTPRPTYSAWFRTQDRRIDVQLTLGQGTLRPRDQVTVTVRTTNAAGKPIAASVVLRAIDEKLFVLGGAQLDDPLIDIYTSPRLGHHQQLHLASRASGRRRRWRRHDRRRRGRLRRDQFRDSLLFRTVDHRRGRPSLGVVPPLGRSHVLADPRVGVQRRRQGRDRVDRGRRRAAVLRRCLDRAGVSRHRPPDDRRARIRDRAPAGAPGEDLRDLAEPRAQGRPITAAAFADVPIRLPALTLGRTR